MIPLSYQIYKHQHLENGKSYVKTLMRLLFISEAFLTLLDDYIISLAHTNVYGRREILLRAAVKIRANMYKHAHINSSL